MISVAMLSSIVIKAQVPTGGSPPPNASNPNAAVTNANFAWYRGGNALGGTATINNIFGFVATHNSNIWHQTSGFSRMLMEKGLGTQVDGRIAYGNNLPGTFVPRDRVHLFEAATSGSVPVRFQNTNTGTAANDGYAIGVDNVVSVVNHTQFENRERTSFRCSRSFD